MIRSSDARALKRALHDGAEIALLDVREAGEFGEAHLFYAVPCAYSRLEIDLPRLVPRSGARLVLYDDGASGVAQRAAARAAALGYSDVQVLTDGTRAWRDAGFELFAGVNVPSKAFGELIEHAWHTPRVTAAELDAMRARGERLVIVDGRPFSEYRKMNIPGGICCPNGELALRIGRIAPDPATTIVVNCAGRTRSIIGAETLRQFGVPNRVLALENGTQGWFLAGLELENGAERRHDAALPDDLEQRRARARAVAERFAIPSVAAPTAAAWLGDASRTTYLFDVRTPEEFAAGSLAGAVHAPGGQLVQATDQWVGVRGARLVLADADGVRATMVAMWLRQMGHDAHVLLDGVRAALAHRPWRPPVPPALTAIDASALDGWHVIDLRASAAYRRGHHPGALWSIRPRVIADARAAPRIALVADDGAIAAAAAIDLRAAGATDVRQLVSPLATEVTPDAPPDAERIDFLFFTHDRHDGNRAAALQYLAWETNLLNQLDAAERAGFRIRPA